MAWKFFLEVSICNLCTHDSEPSNKQINKTKHTININ
jgi:hypothetical protein